MGRPRDKLFEIILSEIRGFDVSFGACLKNMKKVSREKMIKMEGEFLWMLISLQMYVKLVSRRLEFSGLYVYGDYQRT